MTIIPTVDDILKKDLFELLGVEKASDEEKEALVATMTKTVDARVALRVASMLSEEDTNAFQQLADSGDAQKIVDFLVEKGVDLPQIVSEEATRYRIEVAQLLNLAEKQ
ncbi:MAG: DUF5663 domain-containing protein [Candidatus Binatia bacterium]